MIENRDSMRHRRANALREDSNAAVIDLHVI
jgi:hypothetical protein